MASILAGLFGSGAGDGVGKAAEGIGNGIKAIVGSVFTSEGEKLDKQAVLERIAQQPLLQQTAINLVEAQRGGFSAWRAAIGWVCAISLFFYYVPQYVIASILWVRQCWEIGVLAPYPADVNGLMELVLAMLGMAGIHTFEKVKGVSK